MIDSTRFILWGLALGMVVIGLVPPLQNHDVRLASVHFTVLGPIALTLLDACLPGRAKARAGVFYPALSTLFVMLAAMVAPPSVGHSLKGAPTHRSTHDRGSVRARSGPQARSERPDRPCPRH